MSLEAENLGFYYHKDQWLFRNVNFELSHGVVHGITGYSGCGKTSLSKVLANYLQPVEGRVTVDGKSPVDGVFQPVQLIYQHPEKVLNPKWKMKDLLCESYTPSVEIMERFGIRDEWLNRFPLEISGGEMQRFCIVRALNPNTRYIIADEMTTMLDSVTQAEIWSQLLEICKERKIGLAIISHETELVAKLCDKVLSLKQMQPI